MREFTSEQDFNSNFIPNLPMKTFFCDGSYSYSNEEYMEYMDAMRECQGLIDSFHNNTSTKPINSWWVCQCNKSLWSISASSKKQAQNKGLYYFQQYYNNGEYL